MTTRSQFVSLKMNTSSAAAEISTCFKRDRASAEEDRLSIRKMPVWLQFFYRGKQVLICFMNCRENCEHTYYKLSVSVGRYLKWHLSIIWTFVLCCTLAPWECTQEALNTFAIFISKHRKKLFNEKSVEIYSECMSKRNSIKTVVFHWHKFRYN